MRKKVSPKTQKNVKTDNEKPDNSVRVAVIGGIVTIVVTVISVIVAPILLEKVKETPTATMQALSVNTPAVDNTLLPEATATSDNLIYNNDFSDESNAWAIGETTDQYKSMKQSVINGLYYWDLINKDSGLITFIPSDVPVVPNFELSVDVKITGTGISENSSIGLIIRNNKSKYYYFGIRPNQNKYLMAENEYVVDKWNWSPFPGDGGTSSAISQDGFNNIKIIANNQNLSFYINDKLIANIVDDRLKNGTIGFLVYGEKDIPTTFIVDNFRMTSVTPNISTSTLTPISNEELLDTASTQWQKIASDDFSDNQNNWWIEDYTTSDGDYYDATINGKYQIDFKTTNGTHGRFTSDIITVPSGDFFLKADVRRSQQPGCYAGLIWETSTGYYAFTIDDVDAEYELFSYDQNTEKYTDEISWRDSKYILTGETNRLIVIHIGELIKLYVNDQYVGEEISKYRYNGNVGFYTQVCADNAQVTYEFDNLELRTP